MEIFLAIVILIGSFLLLIWGGDKFVDASVGLAKKLKIPPAIIGATLTSIGTTLPELLVTIFAGSSESTSLAVGNALGSIAFNGALIGGILLIFTVVSFKETGKTSAILLLFSICLTYVMSLDKNVAVWECIVLLIVFSAFIFLNYGQAKRLAKTPNIEEQQDDPMYKYIFLFLISATAIGVGAYFLVNKAKFLASLLGFSETLIGLVIVSIGTSLPELITTINAIRKKEMGLGLGNIIGSNIINCSLLMSLSGIMSGNIGLGVDNQTLFITLPITLFISAILLFPTIVKGKSHRWQGIVLITTYLLYYIYLILDGFGVITL